MVLRKKLNGRGSQIRTDDHTPPRRVRYQAALYPDLIRFYNYFVAQHSFLEQIQSLGL